MTGFYLTLLAVLLAGFGGRDQVTVAGLAQRQGPRPGVLVAGIVVSVATAAFAAWAAAAIAPALVPRARMIMAALALVLAGGEALLGLQRRRPAEPTASLGALAIVLAVQQGTDAARFLVFAIAIATHAPLPAGIAGAVGGAVLLAAAWSAPAVIGHARLRAVRRAIGGGLLLIGVFVGLRALGYI